MIIKRIAETKKGLFQQDFVSEGVKALMEQWQSAAKGGKKDLRALASTFEQHPKCSTLSSLKAWRAPPMPSNREITATGLHVPLGAVGVLASLGGVLPLAWAKLVGGRGLPRCDWRHGGPVGAGEA